MCTISLGDCYQVLPSVQISIEMVQEIFTHCLSPKPAGEITPRAPPATHVLHIAHKWLLKRPHPVTKRLIFLEQAILTHF